MIRHGFPQCYQGAVETAQHLGANEADWPESAALERSPMTRVRPDVPFSGLSGVRPREWR